MNKPDNKKLLSKDIDDRFKSEKKFVHDPDRQSNGRFQFVQLTIGIIMAIVAIGGIVIGLITLL
ncbi:hypothetical protein [Secundilactobacillus muriivasis]